MEKKSTSPFKAGLTNGVILGLALIIYSVLLYVLDLDSNKYLGWISYIIMIAIIIYATNNYRKNSLNGFISYSQALGFATIIILIGALMSSIYNYIFVTTIDPESITKMLAEAEEKLLGQGMPDEQIEMTLKIQKKMLQPFLMSILAFFGTAIFGFIIALITSAFLKKQSDPYQEAMQDLEE